MFICSVFQLLTADFKSIEKFENRRFTLKTHQMFSVNKTSEKFENTTESTVSLDFCLSKNRSGKSHSDRNVKMFTVYTKMQSWRFQIPPVWRLRAFSKAPFWWRISVDGRPNRKNTVSFSYFSAIYIYIVCTGPPTNFKVLFQYKKFQWWHDCRFLLTCNSRPMYSRKSRSLGHLPIAVPCKNEINKCMRMKLFPTVF